MTDTRFAHERLDAYQVALRLFADVEALAASLPRGYADLRDQVRRSAAATVRNIAEGANRMHAADKATRFLVARAEVGECAACLEMAGALGLGSTESISSMRGDANRVAAMLTGLVRREQRRAAG